MIVIPAIDIRGGRCVRLRQGKFGDERIYSPDPLKAARRWEGEGAQYLHVVDLDGAKGEGKDNADIIKRIIALSGVPVQVGGGVRSKAKAQQLLDWGAHRVILGTLAAENPEVVEELRSEYGERIAVSIDILGSEVMLRGWEQAGSKDLKNMCAQLAEAGLNTLICTDISRDGMLTGPNFELYRGLSEMTGFKIIASGGVSCAEDVEKLAACGLYGAILGKALYEGALALRDALDAAERGGRYAG